VEVKNWLIFLTGAVILPGQSQRVTVLTVEIWAQTAPSYHKTSVFKLFLNKH